MSSIVDTVRSTVSQNLGGVAHNAAPASAAFTRDQIPDQSGKVAVVTGGSQGIGYGCTHTLLEKNVSKLFILSTSKEVVDSAKDAVKKELGDDKAARTIWIQCDLSDWKGVVQVAKQIKESTDRVDILINNAARGIQSYQLTDYGVDLHMAINHLGHAVLTSELLPLLKSTADKGDYVRIVNLASNLHESTPKDTEFKSLDELNRDLGPNASYGRTKLAAILYSKYLNRHLTSKHPKLLANATHPGIVSTKQTKHDIHEPYPLAGYGMSVGFEMFKKDQWEGSLSTLYAATVTERSGEYICPPAAPEPGSDFARDDQLGENLMKLTREVVQEKAGIEVHDT